MKKLTSIIFYALVTPAITLGAGSVLAQDASVRVAKSDQSTPRTDQADKTEKKDMYRDTDRNNMPDNSRMKNQDYMTTVPANAMHASRLLGAEVQTNNDEDIGEVVDLIVDSNGQIKAVIVSVGGFLGMGEKEVALGWDHVKRSGKAGEQELRIDVNRDELKAAPNFERRD
ncbi:Sporulation protein YlmC, PRC-barrel domain family [Arsukibacterium tuosuense]|uniref:Sporulation protein YlmC, PRC-barrel domain family n=1 Tax=Arsukibacterium tuosuense TaxID=1323745 RepID=A0A285I922_9GAMM|nr:PRC-barrel domain-containing protein [Arsukibacterium tuosuense]SNY44464.1 Sporulation protein YlmC, PRC-barrel domain family [Arsukibacterium tuosuense]